MRSKNLLPVQVVMPSSLMGGGQSAGKAAFEEALHNSIENSLRSPSVAPSTVFSSLFRSYSPSSPTSFSEPSDVKPNAAELHYEVSRQNLDQHDAMGQERDNDPTRPSTAVFEPSITKTSGPPALISVSSGQAVQENSPFDAMQYAPENHSQLLAQQQQLEKIQKVRVEQFKQLQRFQAWQQMQKEQSLKPRMLMNVPHTQPPVSLHATTPMHSSALTDTRHSSSLNAISTIATNGLGSNGNSHGIRSGYGGRNEPSQVKYLKGFCKNGKDIRLSSIEQNSSAIASYPKDFVLLALQPSLSGVGNFIVIAIKLNALPPIESSLQTLIVQCVGCGEKSLHTFAHLVEHIGLETSQDSFTSRRSSTLLMSPHVRFYLVHDRNDPDKLIRGRPASWQNGKDERMRCSAQASSTSTMPSSAVTSFRGNVTMLEAASHPAGITPTRMPGTVPVTPFMLPSAYGLRPALHPHLKRTLSSPMQHTPPEPAKRMVSSASQDEILTICHDDPPPKRYVLNRAENKSVEIPTDLAARLQSKPVVVFLLPSTQPPAFIGDEMNIVQTSKFSECFQESSPKASEKLKIINHSSWNSKFFLLVTVQYLMSLGYTRFLSIEGLACAVMRAKNKLCQDFPSVLKGMKSSEVLAVTKLVTATSGGLVDIVHSKVSIADAVTQCLKSVQSFSCPYLIAVYYPDDLNEELCFHLVVAGKKASRMLAESLHPEKEKSSIISQGLTSLAFTQLRLSLPSTNGAAHCSNASTSQFRMAMSQQRRGVISQLECPARQRTSSNIVLSLLATVEKVYSDHKIADLSDFTSLRFLFLLPPSSALMSQSVQCITDSGVMSELYKTSLPVTSLSSQVVVTMEASSTQSVEANDCLNQPFIINSKNILTIQCSSSPYALLTDARRIPSSNIIFSTKQDNCEPRSNNTSMYFGTSSNCSSSFVTTVDPMYEAERDQMLTSHYTLHTSLIACEVLIQQYSTSLVRSSATKNEVFSEQNGQSTPLVNQIIRDLLSSCQTGQGIVVILRVSSSILGTMFYDSIKKTRDDLNLDRAFEVVLYSDADRPISLSAYFLEILQIYRGADADWFPTSLDDLAGIPCLVVYEGLDLASQAMPSTLKYVDLRLAFEGCGVLYRERIEQEMSLAATLCQCGSRLKETKPRNSSSDDDRLQVVEDNALDSNNNLVEDVTSPGYTWPDRADEEAKEATNRHKATTFEDDTSVDFVSLAMKEADLPSDEKLKLLKKNAHFTPTAILPQFVYDVINNSSQNILSNLQPHPLCSWNEPIRLLNTNQTTSDGLADFFRQWTSPLEGSPDHSNSERIIDNKRILLVTPPNSRPLHTCCKFLMALHNKLMKMLEISIYDDPEDGNEEFGNSFRTLLVNPLHRGISQIANSCHSVTLLRSFMHSGGEALHRKIITRECRNALSTVKLRQHAGDHDSTARNCRTASEYVLKTAATESYKNGLYFRVVIPRRYMDDFSLSAGDDGTVELFSLRLKLKTDRGIKTPLVSLGIHGVEHGLYSLSSGQTSASNKPDQLLHFVVVKDCDAKSYKDALANHVIVILPIEFDYLGNGALKYASQILFEHFYTVECKAANDPKLVWPFVLFINDDIVAWSKWQTNSHSQPGYFWQDVALRSVLQIVESCISYDFAAVGFKPWSSSLRTSIMPRQNMFNQENCLSSCYLESCLILNINLTSSIKFARTRFDNEDIDWSMRAAASGLKLYRFETIAMATKVMPLPEAHNSLLNADTTLVTAADTAFESLYCHPALLLEKHLSYHASNMFPSSKLNPTNPVLCVDCYVSLGTEVCVQFASTAPHAQLWAFDYGKQYGGLIIPSINNNIKSEFLQGLKFVKGAVVCVVGKDRSALRQTVIHLNLETAWHFRLTDEFQTANSQTLGSSRVRPFYFLTGVNKEK